MGFVVQEETLIGVFNQLMEAQDRIVWFHNSVTHLRAGDDGIRGHHTVWVFLTHLRDEKGAHTSASATTQRMAELETLQTIATLRLLPDNVEDGVDELRTLGVVPFCPIVA